MNGTSMAAPNACGCISLLLSAAKASGITLERFNPLVVRRVIQNSACNLEKVEHLGQGSGLIQVRNAWNLITNSRVTTDPWFDVTFDVSVNCTRFSRGIYLRHPIEANTATTFKADISAVFFNKESVPPERLVQFEMRIRLESTADWVTCPSTLLMTSATKTISLAVDPRSLPLGKCHTCSVFGYDEAFPAKGAVFEVPVTVLRAAEIPAGQTWMKVDVPETLSPGHRHRHYVVPPVGCTFVDVVITDQRPPYEAAEGSGGSVSSCSTALPDSAQRTIALHAVQLVLGEPYRDHGACNINPMSLYLILIENFIPPPIFSDSVEKDNYLYMDPGTSKVVSFSVLENVTLELVIASFWSTAGDCNVSVEVQIVSFVYFHFNHLM